MQALLLIDHGSRRPAANARLDEVAAMVAARRPDLIVEPAHMELAAPSIAEAMARCVARGATELVAVPYFLSPGRHVTEDIPQLVEAAARAHPELRFRVAGALGPHPLLAELAILRAVEIP